jgi:flagellin-like hook-associated protein FlgL
MPISMDLATRANLNALQTTQSLLARSSRRIATGLRVNDPLDDAQAYFAAQALNERVTQNKIAQSGIELASYSLDAALAGLEGIGRLLDGLNGLLTNLSTAPDVVSSDRLRAQYNSYLTQIDSLANSAVYQGVNLINNSVTSLKVSFSGVYGQNDLQIQAIRSDSAGFALSTVAAGLFFQSVTTIASQDSRDSIASIASVASKASRAAVNATPALFSQDSLSSSPSVGSVGSLPSLASTASNASIPSQSSTPSLQSIPSQASRSAFIAVNPSTSAPSLSSVASVPSVGSSVSLPSIAGATVQAVNQVLISGIQQTLVNAQSTLTATRSTIGIINALLLVRIDFSKNYVMTAQNQIAQLTAASLSEETANLKAMQTAQDFGLIALAITTQARSNLLRLF